MIHLSTHELITTPDHQTQVTHPINTSFTGLRGDDDTFSHTLPTPYRLSSPSNHHLVLQDFVVTTISSHIPYVHHMNTPYQHHTAYHHTILPPSNHHLVLQDSVVTMIFFLPTLWTISMLISRKKVPTHPINTLLIHSINTLLIHPINTDINTNICTHIYPPI